MDKVELIKLYKEKIDDCYKAYRILFINGKNNYDVLNEIEKFLFELEINKTLTENINLNDEEIKEKYNELVNINIFEKFGVFDEQ